MVDYAIVLVPDFQTHKDITTKLWSDNLLSINHTKAEYVCFKPITVSIETKRPGMDEDSAKIQLGVWAAAHLERLQISSGPNTVLSILSEAIVQGHDWRLKIASMTSDGDVVHLSTFLQPLRGADVCRFFMATGPLVTHGRPLAFTRSL
jgi:hypothetical protein